MVDELRKDLREMCRHLNAALGMTLVSAMGGSKDPRASEHWAQSDGEEPNPAAAARIVFAYEQWQNVARADSEQAARHWFVGMNPWLDDSPTNAIREGRYREVRAAVQAMRTDTFSG